MTSPYPLQWPQGFRRTTTRERGAFRTSFDTALANVRRSLMLFAQDSGRKIVDPILSSNMNPLGGEEVKDPGVAVWFVWDNIQVCIAVDRYATPASNLQAVHHILEARRTELRHGTLQLVRATLQGLSFLPAPKGKHWRDILGIGPDAQITKEAIEVAFKARLKENAHPDTGGDTEAMSALNIARKTALAEIGGGS